MTPKMNVLMAMATACLLSSCTKESLTTSNAPTYSTLAATETQPPVQTTISASVDVNIGGFLQALPAGYATNTSVKYPLIIFMHGTGEKGNGTTDLYMVARNSVPNLIANQQFPASFTVDGKSYSFIVISPQFKNQPQVNQMNDMLNYAIKNYRVDTTRIYVVGLSMGGGATWHYGGLFRSRVAAIVPMCGASGLNDAQCKTMATSGLPIWAFHNDQDPTVTVATTNNWIIHINKYKPTVPPIKTIFHAASHDCWTQASNPSYRQTINGKSVNIYEWLLGYHK